VAVQGPELHPRINPVLHDVVAFCQIESENIKIQSKFINLGSLNDRVGLSNGLTTGSLEIEGAAVFFGISVKATESISAPTFEAGQTDSFPAGEAPVRGFGRRLWRRRR